MSAILGEKNRCIVRSSGSGLDMMVGELFVEDKKASVGKVFAHTSAYSPIPRMVSIDASVDGEPTCTCWNVSTNGNTDRNK